MEEKYVDRGEIGRTGILSTYFLPLDWWGHGRDGY
jgi:hypothetical protein